MEIVLARINSSGDLEEMFVIDNFISYNNVLSLEPSAIKNDFELQVDIGFFIDNEIMIDDWVYIPESEYGGIVKNIENKNNTIYISGLNFRGYLTNHVIVPPYQTEGGGSFLDYSTLEADANLILWEYFQRDDSLVSSYNLRSDPYVVGSKIELSPEINTKFRFVNYLVAMTRTLKENNLRLEARHLYIDYNDPNIRFPDYHGVHGVFRETFVFKIEAKPITDYSELETFSSDFNITINSGIITDNIRDFVFALGSGQMEEREIVVLKNGLPIQYGTHDSTGALWNAVIFDYPNAESREELIREAQEYRLNNLIENEYIELDLQTTNVEFYLGDIIAARDEITNIYTKAEITEKEIIIDSNGVQRKYKVGGLV